MNIYFVRHAQSRQNVKDPENHPFLPEVAEYEENDFSLTAKGEKQADLAGQRLAQVDFTAMICSPMHRTLSTINGIVRYQQNNKTVEIINDVVERGIHSYAGMPIELMRKLFPDMNLIPCPNPTPTGGKYIYTVDEMYNKDDLIARARRVVKYVKNRFNDDDKILIVSHGDFLGRYLLPAFLELPDDAMDIFHESGFGCENAAISKIRYSKKNNSTTLVFLNDYIHLTEEHGNFKIR